MAVNEGFMGRMARIRASMDTAAPAFGLVTQVALDRAAVHLAELDASEWIKWTRYFLIAVETLGRSRGVADEDVEAYLVLVKRELTNRSFEGHW